jgi:MFS family permease
MFGGILLNFAITVPLIFFEQTWLLITVAIVQALSISFFVPAWNATQGDVTRPETRATFIGKLAAIGRLVSVSFSLIIAIVFYLADEIYLGRVIWGWTVYIPWRIQYSIAFAIAAVNSLITAILILSMKETKAEDVEQKKLQMKAAFKVRKFMVFVVFYALFGLSMSFIWPINPIMQVNVLDMEFYQIAIISSVFLIVMSLTQFVTGKLGDRIGRKPLFVFGAFVLVLYPVSNLPALYSGDWRWQLLGNFVAGFGTGTFFVALNALTLDLASNELMGTFSGVREMFWGIATFIGSLSAGFLVDFLEVKFGLLIATIAMCIGVTCFRLLTAVGFLFVTESLPKEERENRLNHKNSKIKG